MRIAVFIALWAASAAAQEPEPQGPPGINTFVDRFSERLDAGFGVEAEDERFRAIVPARDEGDRATITGATMKAPADGVDRITLSVTMPTPGPRLLLVDAGAVLRGPGGADYVLVPNQKFLLESSQAKVTAEALPIWPNKARPKPGSPLKAIWSNDPGLIAVLRTAQRIEAEDAARLERYVKEKDGAFVVDTYPDNQDTRLARRMSWSRNVVGKVEGRLPRDDIRFALFAVTSGYTLTQSVDWIRLERKMGMQAAIDFAWTLQPGIEYLLERATLDHRVFSPRHAEYHFNQGVAAYQRNDLPAAQKAFETALDKQPEMVEAKYNLGVIMYRLGQYDGAKNEFLVAAGMPGATADVHYNKGAAQYRLGDKLGAARAFRKALEANARHPDAKTWLEKADPEGKTAPKKKKKKKKRRRRRRR